MFVLIILTNLQFAGILLGVFAVGALLQKYLAPFVFPFASYRLINLQVPDSSHGSNYFVARFQLQTITGQPVLNKKVDFVEYGPGNNYHGVLRFSPGSSAQGIYEITLNVDQTDSAFAQVYNLEVTGLKKRPPTHDVDDPR